MLGIVSTPLPPGSPLLVGKNSVFSKHSHTGSQLKAEAVDLIYGQK